MYKTYIILWSFCFMDIDYDLIEEMLQDEDFCDFSIEELEEILEFALSDNQ